MPKKWVPGGRYPEGKRYLIEVSVPKLKKTKDGVPESPLSEVEGISLSTERPRTLPGIGVTGPQLEESEKRGGPSTQAAHIAEALESKEE